MAADKTEKNYDACAAPGQHREHMCLLMEKGQSAEVRARSRRPAFACANCGARADRRDDLCRPRPLEAGP